MKITKEKIRQLIQEELADLQQEMGYGNKFNYRGRKGDEDHSGPTVGGPPPTNPYLATVRAKMKEIWNVNKKVTDEDAQKIVNDMADSDPNIDKELLQKAVEVALRDFRPLPLVKAYSDSSIKVNIK
jgi:hypothetical protein